MDSIGNNQMELEESTLSGSKPLHIVPEILPREETEAVKDPALLQEHIGSFKSRIQDLIAEVYELNIQKSQDQDQHQIIVQKMEQDHQQYCSQIQNYTCEVARLESAEMQDEAGFADMMQKERRCAEALHVAEVGGLSKRIEDLQAEYLEEKKYQDMERQSRDKLERLQAMYVEEQYKHHDAMNLKQKAELERTANAKTGNETQTKTVMKGAYNSAKDKVITEQKQAFGQKILLKEDLSGLQKQLQRLRKQTNKASVRTKEAKINASINIESLQQYKAVGALQIVRIRSFKDKVEDVKTQIQEETQKRRLQIEQIQSKGKQRLKQLSICLSDGKKAKSQVQNDLLCVKDLASTIVRQRAQLEQFFGQALERLKEESRKDGSSNKEQKIYSEKVDIKELDAADKERIVRTLLTRISIGAKNDSV